MNQYFKEVKLKKLIIDVIDDMITDLLYYDRKEDEELPMNKIEEAIKDEVITIDEILSIIRLKFEQAIK